MLRLLLGVFRDLFRSQASLEAQIVTLRHQVAVLPRRLVRRKLQLTCADRALVVLVARVWSGWREAVYSLGLKPIVTTLRRECLDHVVAVNERQVQRVLDEYQRYYNRSRTHLSLK